MHSSIFAVICFLIFAFSMAVFISTYMVTVGLYYLFAEARQNTREQIKIEIALYSSWTLSALTYWLMLYTNEGFNTLTSGLPLWIKIITFGFLLFFGMTAILYRFAQDPT